MSGTSAQSQGRQAAQQVQDSRAFDVLVRVGLVSFGLVHLLIAWIALQLAWSSDSSNANSTGALRTLAGGSLGTALLWIIVFGLLALVVWQLSQALWGYAYEDGGKRTAKRLTSVGRAVVYGALAYSAFGILTGSSKGGSSPDSLTAELLQQTGGQLVVALVGLGILVVGVVLIVRGVKASFTHHLQPAATSGTRGNVIVKLGQAGYIAKGVALGVIGALFVWAAFSDNAQKAGGLDAALQTLLDQGYGSWLVTLVALGFAAFGAYCFAWARYPRE